MDENLQNVEDEALEVLVGKFVNLSDENKRKLLGSVLKRIKNDITDMEIEDIYKNISNIPKIGEFLKMGNIEDIMINNTENTFIYDAKTGYERVSDATFNTHELDTLVNKLKLYATNKMANGNIMDIHLPSMSRASIVASPKGYNITIRNFRSNPLSILDLINLEELDYDTAARMWLYLDGFGVKPANIIIGGIAASGKTTLLNAMLSFFRPDMRLVTIEETYELNTSLFENSINLETNMDMSMEDLIKSALRMRADAIIIGEVRGVEARDMISAMNIGKMSLSTIHASSARDVVNRLSHSPMNVPVDIIPVIDAIVVLSRIYNGGARVPRRRVVQVAEVAGPGSQILLSDLYRYNYKDKKPSSLLPSVSYRDSLSRAIGVEPSEILAEEKLRSVILARMNELGKRSISEISDSVQDYYAEPESLLNRLGMKNAGPIIRL